MNIINLTPHTVRVIRDGVDLTIEPTSPAARVTMEDQQIGTIDGIPVMHKRLGPVVDLPDPVPDTVYIVSLVVAQQVVSLAAAQQAEVRTDLVVTNDGIRDGNNKIIGCRSFSALYPIFNGGKKEGGNNV